MTVEQALGAAAALVDGFIDDVWLQSGLSRNTLSAYRSDLQKFAAWAHRHGHSLITADGALLTRYLGDRENLRSARSAARALSTLKRFYHHAVTADLVEINPCAALVAPAIGKPLPHTLSEAQVEALLAAPHTHTALGLRDRAMIETLYATGLRVSELVRLELGQLNLQAGVCRTIGKGNKERLVPLGEQAMHWLQRYLSEARPGLLRAKQSHAVFITRSGAALTRQAMWHNLRRYTLGAGVRAHVSPHILRHAFATHLLNHGADLRSVQMLLGHASLSTTQIYTHIAKARLKALHHEHHPRG